MALTPKNFRPLSGPLPPLSTNDTEYAEPPLETQLLLMQIEFYRNGAAMFATLEEWLLAELDDEMPDEPH